MGERVSQRGGLVRIGSLLQQETDHGQVVRKGGPHERRAQTGEDLNLRVLDLRSVVDIGSLVQQGLHRGQVAARRGGEDRADANLVPLLRVGTAVEQEADRWRITVPAGGQDQGRGAQSRTHLHVGTGSE
jgi:hypothetical protein